MTLPPGLYRALRRFYERVRFVQPLMRGLNRTVFRVHVLPVRFRGWEMATAHELPWVDEHFGETFRAAARDIHRFEFTPSIAHTAASLDALRWRHWIVWTAARMALTFRDPQDRDLCGVECGVGDGLTAFFALREFAVTAQLASVPYEFHLYDAWAGMRADLLTPGEQASEGRYGDLDLARTLRNLAEFRAALEVHPGYVPETFHDGAAPARVNYVHVDLNAAEPTLAACEHWWPRLKPGGVFVFDDYGWPGYEETKRAIDAFFADRPGVMVKFPTGQAMFVSHVR